MIMAGGGGTRFWPRSRQRRPKQFLTLSGDRTLLQLALDRVEVLAPPERTWGCREPNLVATEPGAKRFGCGIFSPRNGWSQ